MTTIARVALIPLKPIRELYDLQDLERCYPRNALYYPHLLRQPCAILQHPEWGQFFVLLLQDKSLAIIGPVDQRHDDARIASIREMTRQMLRAPYMKEQAQLRQMGNIIFLLLLIIFVMILVVSVIRSLHSAGFTVLEWLVSYLVLPS